MELPEMTEMEHAAMVNATMTLVRQIGPLWALGIIADAFEGSNLPEYAAKVDELAKYLESKGFKARFASSYYDDADETH